MPKPFSERIVHYLNRPDYEPMKARRLARAMSVGEAEYGDFQDAVDALRRVGRVVLGTKNALMLPYAAGQIVGIYRANPRGFGFVIPNEASSHADLYIPAGRQKDALTGDMVLCDIVKRGSRGGKMMFGGRILRVIERGENRFVGQLALEDGLWFVRPDGNALHIPIVIGDPGAKSAQVGDQVVVEITQYPSEGKPAQGVIVKRLGGRGEPGVDLVSIVHQYHLSFEFPENVMRETQELVRDFQPEKAAETHDDLSEQLIITIDPDAARDFDDAISLCRVGSKSRSQSGRGGKKEFLWELGVHIADVSTFVAIGSALDREAARRGTSVYLSTHVIPMLPEVLSNGLCSLQEGVPRLTKSVFIRYDEVGNVVGARFANSIIRCDKRLTYQQATEILDGRTEGYASPIIKLLQSMERLARTIQARRTRNGMLVLSLPAVDLILNKHGEVIDAKPEDTSFSHTLIEMFMVEANEAVARLMNELHVPCLRRIHPEPNEDSFSAMARFVRAAKLPLPKKVTPSSLQRLLDELRDRPEGYAVNLAVLKSMQMAEYSPELIGHFALASEHYAHFTSPIRRYPDLMVHRLLQLYLNGDLPRRKGSRRHPALLKLAELKEHGRRMSFLSRRAEEAERELKAVKILTLLGKDIGDTFDGVVTGVTSFGLFIQHPKYLVDGLLRIEDLGDDWWEVDVKRGRITGERSQQTYTLGTTVDVRIVALDIPARQLQLGLTDTRKKPTKKRRPKKIHKTEGRSIQSGKRVRKRKQANSSSKKSRRNSV